MNEAFSEFWSGLKQTLGLNSNSSLDALDSAFIHALQAVISVLDSLLSEEDILDQALSQVLQSDVFQCHSQRMIGILIGLLSNPHSTPSTILVACHLLLRHGLDNHSFFRTLRNHSPPSIAAPSTLISGLTTSNLGAGSSSVMRTLMCISRRLAFVPQNFTESNIAIIYTGHESSGETNSDIQVSCPNLPNEKQAERRLGPVLAGLLYELCRVQKLEQDLLDVVDESLVGNLFELVELTRDQEDETFNYNLIKLIIALNEQFMVYSIDQSTKSSSPAREKKSASSASHNNIGRHRHRRQSCLADTDTNIVIRTMKARLDESKTFGENLIFILNRSSNTSPEGLCVSLLILKILYLLFTTLGTHEYFYTNDLCVLVDVFIRELSDLPDESESLRHTYLRVLHPLLTSTQLRSHPYKRREIRHVLLSHIKYAHLREVNPTTKRLVERNLRADWCLELEGTADLTNELSLPSKPNRSMSVETLASQASGSLASVADVTTSSAARSSPIDADIAKAGSKACTGEGGSPEVPMGGARASIPSIVHAQAERETVVPAVSVVIQGDQACASSAPVSSGSSSHSPSIGHDERLRQPWMEPTNDTYASPLFASPHSRPSSTISHLLYTHSYNPDQPPRPASASSTSSLPRRPAPKPPSTKRATKDPIPHVLRNGPSLPTLRHQAHNQIGLSTLIAVPNPLRRTLSTSDSPTQERAGPDQDFYGSHEDPSRTLSATTTRRAPPCPPNSQPAHSTSVARRRKAPQPPAQQRQPLDSTLPVLVETVSTQTRSLRSTKSNINLSRNNNVSLNHHHPRVASFSSNPRTTPRGEDFDPFQDKSEFALV